MIKYGQYGIYAINTLGKWYALIYRDGECVFSGKRGYTERNACIAMAKIRCAIVGFAQRGS